MTPNPHQVEADPAAAGPLWPIPPAHRQAVVDELLAIAFGDADTGRRIEAVRLIVEMDRCNLIAEVLATVEARTDSAIVRRSIRLIAAA